MLSIKSHQNIIIRTQRFFIRTQPFFVSLIYDNVLFYMLDRAMDEADWPKGAGFQYDWYYIAAILSGPLLLVTPIILLALIVQALQPELRSFPVYMWLGLAISLTFLAWGVCILRDLRSWRSVAWLQVLLGAVTAVWSLLVADHLSVSDVIAALSAVFLGADGFKRLREISNAQATK
jgi:hypothetical protein